MVVEIAGAREDFVLDPDVVFLNHGSFGATPRPVLDAQTAWRARMEAEPVLFLDRQIHDLLDQSRIAAARFLRADPAGLVFVPNATTGINTVVHGLRLTADDEVLTTDHAYPAVRHLLDTCPARLIVAPIPLPPPADITERIAACITPRTKLLVIDQVASPTGLRFPVEQVVLAARARGVPVLVDGAHAPGMLDVDIDALAPDFWAGNFHKWACAPKGAGALWVSEPYRDALRPLVTSHDYLVGLHRLFDWLGTYDPTPFLTIPAALEVAQRWGGWDAVRAHNNALAATGREIVAASLDAEQVVPDALAAAMTVVPAPGITTREAGRAMTERLYSEHRIEVPVVSWNGTGYARLSAHVYNTESDYEALADALKR